MPAQYERKARPASTGGKRPYRVKSSKSKVKSCDYRLWAIDYELNRSEPSTVDEVGALTYFDDVAVGVADVAAYLAVLGYGRGDELGAAAFP